MDMIAKSMLGIITSLAMMLTGCKLTQTPDSSQPTEETEMTQTLTAKTYAAEEQYVKTIGRTHSEEGILWLAHSASGVEFTMTGTAASVTVVGDNMISQTDNMARFAAYVDGERVLDEMIDEPEKTFDIYADPNEKTVTITLLKLSEAANSTMGIKAINVMSNGDIQPTSEKELKVEFIGDSITCGYGVDDEDRNHHFSTTTEDATKAYAYKTAQLLDADYSLVSYSGHGIISGYTTKGKKVAAQQLPAMYEQFARSYGNYNGFSVASVNWDFSKFVPDIIVINLGTNDASYTGNDKELRQEYTDAYVEFLKKVRKDNPSAKIVCALGVMGQDLYNAMSAAVDAYTAETSDNEVYALKLSVQDGNANGYAADWHPVAASHDTAAKETADFLRTLLAAE